MKGTYVIAMDQVAVTAIQDLFEIVAPSNGEVEILSAFIGQHTDVGDAAAESLPLTWSRSTGVSGSGGTTATAQALDPDTSTYGGTCEKNNTTQATTTTVLESHVWNTQAGWYYEPVPEDRITVAPSARLVLELPVAPADSITVSGFVRFLVTYHG